MFRKPEIETPRDRIEPAPAAAPAEREPQQARTAAVIGSTIRIKGDISGDENLTVDGTVEGTISVKQHVLQVGKSGRVNADVFAKAIRIEGHVEGNLRAEEQVLLRSSGVVRGNISSPRLTMEDGCSFKGSVDMEPAVDRKGTAEPVTQRRNGPGGNGAETDTTASRMANPPAARAG